MIPGTGPMYFCNNSIKVSSSLCLNVLMVIKILGNWRNISPSSGSWLFSSVTFYCPLTCSDGPYQSSSCSSNTPSLRAFALAHPQSVFRKYLWNQRMKSITTWWYMSEIWVYSALYPTFKWQHLIYNKSPRWLLSTFCLTPLSLPRSTTPSPPP